MTWNTSGFAGAGTFYRTAHEPPCAVDMRQSRSGTIGRSLFDSGDYLKCHGTNSILSVTASDHVLPLLFERRDDHAVLLARALPLNAATIEEASSLLFQGGDIRFVVFRDIDLDRPVSRRPTAFHFRYQNDWIVRLDGDADALSKSIRCETDRKLRNLNRDHGDVRLIRRERPDRATAEAIIEFNRRKIESAGGQFLIDDAERERLVRLFAACGVAALLFDGDRLIAGDIFAVNAGRAYLLVRGYDEAYARFSPGLITLRHAIEHLQAQRFQAAHLGWGDNPYKKRFASECMPLATVIVARDKAAWASRGFLRAASEHGFKDVKRRIKETPWIFRPLEKTLRWRRALENVGRGNG